MSTLGSGLVGSMERTVHPTGDKPSGFRLHPPATLNDGLFGHGSWRASAGLGNVEVRGVLRTQFFGLDRPVGFIELRRRAKGTDRQDVPDSVETLQSEPCR
jgi:hypothetical protein